MRTILTYRDYEGLPADGRRYELHEGELSVIAAPNPKHQRVIGNLYVVLRQHVVGHGLGEVLLSPIDCILRDITVVQPDIVYLETARAPQVSSRGIEGSPTLVVEILSPSTMRMDWAVKLLLYARHRVPWYWIVDPDARILEVHRLAGDAYHLAQRAEGSETLSASPFDGLRLPLDSLWP